MCWWWRKVRKAEIPKSERDLFERHGELSVRLILAEAVGASTPTELAPILGDQQRIHYAVDWLTEQADQKERREQRLETVEVGILILVGVKILFDVARLFG